MLLILTFLLKQVILHHFEVEVLIEMPIQLQIEVSLSAFYSGLSNMVEPLIAGVEMELEWLCW